MKSLPQKLCQRLVKLWPIPKHKYGYPLSQLETIFCDHGELWGEFWEFMQGQTGSFDDKTGEIIVYSHDFKNFFKSTFFD